MPILLHLLCTYTVLSSVTFILLSYVFLARANVPVVLVTDEPDLYAVDLFTIYALLLWMMPGNVSVAVNAHAMSMGAQAQKVRSSTAPIPSKLSSNESDTSSGKVSP